MVLHFALLLDLLRRGSQELHHEPALDLHQLSYHATVLVHPELCGDPSAPYGRVVPLEAALPPLGLYRHLLHLVHVYGAALGGLDLRESHPQPGVGLPHGLGLTRKGVPTRPDVAPQVRIKEAEEAAQGVEQPSKLLDLAEAYGVLRLRLRAAMTPWCAQESA